MFIFKIVEVVSNSYDILFTVFIRYIVQDSNVFIKIKVVFRTIL